MPVSLDSTPLPIDLATQQICRECRRLEARPRLMRRARPGKPLSGYHQRQNQTMGRVRSFMEWVNATLKRFMRCSRAVYIGLEKVHLPMTLGVLAYNLRRYAALSLE